MTPLAVVKRCLPGPVYGLARRAGLAAFGSIVGADVGESPLVAVTFDDGPGPATPAILDVLAAHQARATFFLVGQNVRALPEVSKAIVRAGHEVGNHTFSHRALPSLARADRDREIGAGRDAIFEATGVEPRLLRPPFGFQNVGSYLDTRRAGYTVVGWSLVGEDWRADPPRTIAARITDTAAPGDIALLHDGSDQPGDAPDADRRATVAALVLVLEHFRARRLRAVTVSELLSAGRARRKLWFRSGRPADPGVQHTP
jgi:peptidoglycan/xylan/chitin deacetylase (PgdA/CDA1 family)